MKLAPFLILLISAFGFGSPDSTLSPQSFLQKVIIQRHAGPEHLLAEESIRISDKENPHFYIHGVLFYNGGLLLDIKTVSTENGIFSRSNIQGKDLLNLLLQLFGDRVRWIESVWIQKKSDNLVSFNEALRKGKPFKEAVLSTWSGKMFVRDREMEAYIKNLKGPSGSYQRVILQYFPKGKSFKNRFKSLWLNWRHHYQNRRLSNFNKSA